MPGIAIQVQLSKLYESLRQEGATIKIGRGRGGHITTESVQKLNRVIGRTEERGDSGCDNGNPGQRPQQEKQKQEIPKRKKKKNPRSAPPEQHQACLILQRALQFGILQLAFVLPEESSSQLGVGLSCLACLLVEYRRNERPSERGGFNNRGFARRRCGHRGH